MDLLKKSVIIIFYNEIPQLFKAIFFAQTARQTDTHTYVTMDKIIR